MSLVASPVCLPAAASEADLVGDGTPTEYIIDDAKVLNRTTRSELGSRLKSLEVMLELYWWMVRMPFYGRTYIAAVVILQAGFLLEARGLIMKYPGHRKQRGTGWRWQP